jgi:hypothetical protein
MWATQRAFIGPGKATAPVLARADGAVLYADRRLRQFSDLLAADGSLPHPAHARSENKYGKKRLRSFPFLKHNLLFFFNLNNVLFNCLRFVFQIL